MEDKDHPAAAAGDRLGDVALHFGKAGVFDDIRHGADGKGVCGWDGIGSIDDRAGAVIAAGDDRLAGLRIEMTEGVGE